jgi:uncharacterized protein (DUF1330 family)
MSHHSAMVCAACVLDLFNKSEEHAMNRYMTVGLAMLTGAGIGAAAVNTLHAQNKGPGAYAVVDISEITDANIFRQQLLPKASPAQLATFGGRYVIRAENVAALDGAPPQRFVVIAFDNMEKARAWNAAPAQQEVEALRKKSTKSREFLVNGFSE